MKIYKFISIILLLLFAVALVQCGKETGHDINDHAIEQRSVNPCLPDFTILPDCIEIEFNWYVEIPNYPGCNFEVQILMYECYDGLDAIAYHLADFEILNHNCLNYNIDLQNAISNGVVNHFNIIIQQQIWMVITQLLLNSTPPSYSYVAMSYYIADCSKFCSIEVQDGPFTALVMQKLICGLQCCKLQQGYHKKNGVWKLTNRKVSSPEYPCRGAIIPDCPRGTTYSTECYPQCEVFNFN